MYQKSILLALISTTSLFGNPLSRGLAALLKEKNAHLVAGIRETIEQADDTKLWELYLRGLSNKHCDLPYEMSKEAAEQKAKEEAAEMPKEFRKSLRPLLTKITTEFCIGLVAHMEQPSDYDPDCIFYVMDEALAASVPICKGYYYGSQSSPQDRKDCERYELVMKEILRNIITETPQQ